MSEGDSPAAGRRNLPPRLVDPLLHCTAYTLTGHEPRFLRHVSEGNVSYYGLLLQATGDAGLRDYLLGTGIDGLWEYHTGFGVTADDTALVLEGLHVAGADPALLRHSATRLVDEFFSEEDGAFRAVLGGQSSYWRDVSVETTAQVAWLLHVIDHAAWQEKVERCTQFLRRRQHEDGYWEGKWSPSHIVPTWFVVRLLRDVALERTAQRLLKARDYLLRTQLKNGSWSNLLIDTSAAILALRKIGGAEAAVEKGYEWLQGRLRTGALAGEPVLYYWYDEADRKTFFCARDAGGRIAKAWVTLAVRAR